MENLHLQEKFQKIFQEELKENQQEKKGKILENQEETKQTLHTSLTSVSRST
jgi:hypothetical protein